MAEAITESFCERCGTRYEFKAPTRLNPLRRTRGLVSGLRNYIMSQDALGEAIGDAMRTEEDALATAQLEAFHESFNFCINCRQYTCLKCWNDGAGRCRTCAPIVGTDDLLERMEVSYAGGNGGEAGVPQLGYDAAIDEANLQRRLGVEPWPTVDLPTNGETPTPGPEAEPEPIIAEAAPEPPAAPEPELEAEPVAAEIEPEPLPAALEPEPMPAAPEPEPLPAAPEPAQRPPLRVVAWDEDLVAAAEVEPEVAPPAEVEPEPEAEPIAAAAEAEVEPPPSEPEPPAIRPIAPIAETILRLPPRPAAEPPQPVAKPQQPVAEPPAPEVEPVAAEREEGELAARRAQLDQLGLGDPGQGPVAPVGGTVLPYRSRGATAHASEAARLAAARGAMFWEASAREVAGATSQIGVQNCGGCGLSLSANARFCRRCGTRQARSA